jgi:hypothetical protein
MMGLDHLARKSKTHEHHIHIAIVAHQHESNSNRLDHLMAVAVVLVVLAYRM